MLKKKINVFSYIMQECKVISLAHSVMELVMSKLLPVCNLLNFMVEINGSLSGPDQRAYANFVPTQE